MIAGMAVVALVAGPLRCVVNVIEEFLRETASSISLFKPTVSFHECGV